VTKKKEKSKGGVRTFTKKKNGDSKKGKGRALFRRNKTKIAWVAWLTTHSFEKKAGKMGKELVR